MADQTDEERIKQQYKASLGRDPTQAELSSDLENTTKYGWNSGAQGGVQATIANRATNTPNQGQGGVPSTNQAPAQAWNTATAASPVQSTATGANADPRADALYKELLDRSQQGLAITGSDPIISGQVDAFRAEQERGKRNYLSDLAEQGGQYANLRGEQRMAAEKTGQATSGFQAELLGRELQSRRQEIAQALTQRSAMLSNDQQAALARELAQLDAEIKRQGMAQQESQFGRSLAQGGSQFSQQLGQGNEQFQRELALRQWQLGDQSALNWAQL